MHKFSWLAVMAAIGSVWPTGCASSGRSVDPATLGPAGADIKVHGVT